MRKINLTKKEIEALAALDGVKIAVTRRTYRAETYGPGTYYGHIFSKSGARIIDKAGFQGEGETSVQCVKNTWVKWCKYCEESEATRTGLLLIKVLKPSKHGTKHGHDSNRER